MSDEAGEKKFDLSEKRRQQLRDEGSIPKSPDVSTTVTLAVGLGFLTCGGAVLIENLRDLMRNSFVMAGHTTNSLSAQHVSAVLTNGVWLWLAFFSGGIALAVFVGQVAQVGVAIADDPFGPKFEKLNPLTGLQNSFSVNRLTMTGQSFVKLAVVTRFA